MAKKKKKKKQENKKQEEVSSRIDLHCFSDLGSGKDSIIRLYYSAIQKKLDALVITDKFPGTKTDSFYRAHDLLEDLDQMRKDGWKQKIPVIVGLEYTWPEWLIGGLIIKTLVFGSQAIDQLIGLERYRSIDGYDADGNLYRFSRSRASAYYFSGKENPLQLFRGWSSKKVCF